MDGRGRWMDNVFIERLWRSLKYEDVYLKGYADGREARAGIAAWIGFYNGRRPHQALAGRTPMAVWREGVTGALADNAVDMTLRLDDAARVAHMPTATTATATDASSGVIEEDGAGQLPIKNDGPVVPPMGSTSDRCGVRQTKFRGLDRVRMAFTFALAAYNLVRLPKLVGKTA